jgi:hypothetical protein
MNKPTFFKIMLLAAVLFVASGSAWGQGTLSSPIFSEDFGTLANGTALSTSNTAFSYVRVSTSTTTNSLINQIVAKSPGSFTNSSGLISSKGGSISTVDKTGLTSFSSGTFTFKFKTPSSLTSAVMLSAVGTGISFGSANTFTGAQLSAGFQVSGTNLQVRASGSWSTVQTVDVSTSYTIAIVINNTAGDLTYGDSKTLPSNKCHVWINGAYVNEYNTATASLAASAFRIYTTTAEFEVDDVAVYNTLPASGGTSAVATPTFSVAGTLKTTDTYWNNAQVELASTTEGASIYYTTNGSAPTASSTLYTGSAINITSTTTIKAIAIKSGMDNSTVAEKTITIATPATATVPYTEAFNNTLGDWVAYQVAGAKPRLAQTTGAYMNGFGGGDVQSWLISPKFTATSAGLAFSFNYESKYIGNGLVIKKSSNYNGYGNPTEATWTDLTTIDAPSVQDNDYTVKASGNIISSTEGTVYFALVYTNAAAPYSDWRITNASVITAPLATEPTITVTEITVPAMTAVVGSTDTQTIQVSGVNLTGNISITIDGTNAGLFSATPTTVTQTGGTAANTTVTITYTPSAEGSHTATLKLNSAGATEVTRTLSGTATLPMSTPNVIITEVYGGGGNSGATYTNDFIELYNTTESSVEIGGWSVQYYSATGSGTSTNVIVIPDGKYIPGKSHFLIQGSGGSVGVALPTADASGTLNASATAGKIVLYTTGTAQTLANATDISLITGNSNFKDYVPFGTTSTPVWGTAMSSNASNTTSATRKMVGAEYVYTQNIGNDFEVVAPNPQNTGLSTGLTESIGNDFVSVIGGSIVFNASANQTVDIYNAIGQRIMSKQTVEGLNAISVPTRGVVLVKVGEKVSKVIL